MGKSLCQVEEDGKVCGKPTRARGMCSTHYKRWTVHGDPLMVKRGGGTKTATGQCEAEEDGVRCEAGEYARRLCRRHYNRAYQSGTLQVNRLRRKGEPVPECSVSECGQPARSGGYCIKHYQRVKKHGDPLVVLLEHTGEYRPHPEAGYMFRVKTVDGVRTYDWEHRTLIEGLLGRPLRPGEEVHHLNTITDDNRIDGPLDDELKSGNLQLWYTSQPKGGRVVDLIEYVTDFHLAAVVARALTNGRREELLLALKASEESDTVF